jgi:hypothetical protein
MERFSTTTLARNIGYHGALTVVTQEIQISMAKD